MNSNIKVTANEDDISLFYANNYILEEKSKNTHKIYPNIYSLSDRLSRNDVINPVMFPDITSEDKNMSLTTYPESFAQVCENHLEAESVDIVVTWFFLDTAKNVLEYVELIEKILKPDGLWINMGGLQYMYEPYESVESIEISYKDLLGAIIDFGFLIETEKLLEHYEYCFIFQNVVESASLYELHT